MAAGLSRSMRFVPWNIGMRSSTWRLRSDRPRSARWDGRRPSAGRPPGNVPSTYSERPGPFPLISTGMRPSQTVWSHPPEPKLVWPPIMTKPPPRLLTSSTVHSSCSGVNADRAMSLQMTTS